MNKEKAKEVNYLLQDIETVENQLQYLQKHSFGFGTAYRDIDDHLRPLAKFYLEAKLERLTSQLKDY